VTAQLGGLEMKDSKVDMETIMFCMYEETAKQEMSLK
jgi:hypothetical protein